MKRPIDIPGLTSPRCTHCGEYFHPISLDCRCTTTTPIFYHTAIGRFWRSRNDTQRFYLAFAVAALLLASAAYGLTWLATQ